MGPKENNTDMENLLGEASEEEESSFDRRRLLQALGATGTAALFAGNTIAGNSNESTDTSSSSNSGGSSGSESSSSSEDSSGETYTVESTPENVDWGAFDPNRDPVLKIESGDTVTMQTVTPPRDNHVGFLTSEGIPRSEILEDEVTVSQEVPETGPGPHVVTGPVYVKNAEPGDILEVRVKDIEIRAPYGINLFTPGAGALPEMFPWQEMDAIPLDRENMIGNFKDIDVPLDPFFGVMSVSPQPSAGRTSTGPPSYFGGNMDNKQLTAGSTVYFPVNAEGALFWAGDGHSAQGNGEVSVTAIETSLTGTFEFVLHKDVPRLDWPVAETDEYYIPMGFDPDLDECMKHAVREAIAFLVHQKGLSPADAYQLCSIAVDFNITQVVDGTEGIHALVPKCMFPEGGDIDPEELGESV